MGEDPIERGSPHTLDYPRSKILRELSQTSYTSHYRFFWLCAAAPGLRFVTASSLPFEFSSLTRGCQDPNPAIVCRKRLWITLAGSGRWCLRRCCRNRECRCARRRWRFGRSSRGDRSGGFRRHGLASPSRGRRNSAWGRVA